MSDNKSKVAFITGANRGIGFETARELAEKGVTVLLGSRDLAKGETAAAKLKAKGYNVSAVKFDVNNPEDHKNLVQFIDKTYGKLDILVNNAGVWLETETASRSNSDALRKTFESNFFDVIASTQLLLPLLRKSPEGRIVNLSSILGSLVLHSDPKSPIYESKNFAYNSSKTALNAFTVHLAHDLRDSKIKVNSAHPGWVKTDMGGEAAPVELVDGGKTSVALALLDQKGPSGGFFHAGETLPW